jgi:long-chain fatty acid transport protein
MRHAFRRGPLALAISLLCLHGTVLATNGDQRVGLNATQAGMAGAVVAMPEDSATLFTNPAGLAGLGMESVRLDMGFSLLNPPRSINGVDSDSNLSFLPTGAVAFRLNPRLVLGMGLSGVSGFGVDVADAFPNLAGNQAVVTQREVLQFSPALAFQVTDRLALGASLNIYNQSLALSSPQFSLPQNRQFGFGVTLGATWRASPAWQLGLAYTSKQNASAHEFNTADGKVSLDLDGPASLALGAAYIGTPGLVVEADVKRIWFNDVRDQVAFTRPAGYGGPVPAQIPFGWKDQTVYAIGMRKQMGPATTLRLGLNHGASPIGAAVVDTNLGSVAIVETQLGLGVTRRLTENLSGNFAYSHAFENRLTSPTGNRISLEQRWLHFQVTYQL